MNEIYLYDEIGYGCSANFAQQFSEAIKLGSITVHINSGGGFIHEGLAIYNLIKHNPISSTTIVDGVACSMASIICCSGKPAKMRKNALMMLHSASTWCAGNTEDMRQCLAELNMFDNILAGIYATKTGKTPEEIKAAYFDGKDHWLTADECLALGLVDEVIDDITNVDMSGDWKNKFKNVLILKPSEMKFESLWAKLGIATTASVEEAERKVAEMQQSHETLKAENERLKTANSVYETEATARKAAEQTAREAEIEAVLTDAMKVGKIKPEMKDHYKAMLTANLESTKAVIASLTAGISLTGNTGAGAENDARKDWTFDDYHKKDGKALTEMRANNPEKFKALYVAKFGREPKMD